MFRKKKLAALENNVNIYFPQYISYTCTGILQHRSISLFSAVNGGWGEWGSFSTCSQSCGGGIETRQRVCDSPSPSNGGESCPGDMEETRACNIGICVPGKFCNICYWSK